MTEAELKMHHRELWQWLYDNPSKDVCQWPGWDRNDLDILRVEQWGMSFACYVVRGGIPHNCRYACPLDQKVMRGCRSGYKTKAAFVHWQNAGSVSTRKKYAKLIMNAWREVLSEGEAT